MVSYIYFESKFKRGSMGILSEVMRNEWILILRIPRYIRVLRLHRE